MLCITQRETKIFVTISECIYRHFFLRLLTIQCSYKPMRRILATIGDRALNLIQINENNLWATNRRASYSVYKLGITSNQNILFYSDFVFLTQYHTNVPFY